tara:strand:- start:589 stop:1005 length:417 start_codon:yes stop_codon:yes gene_type:complete
MVLKIVTVGSEEKYLNGEPIVDKHFNVKINSEKKPKKQVSATIMNSGNIYHTTDSLQSFINNLNKQDDSLFEFLGKEQYRLKHTLPLINNKYNCNIKCKNKPKKSLKKLKNKNLSVSKKLKKTRKILKKPFTRRVKKN